MVVLPALSVADRTAFYPSSPAQVTLTPVFTDLSFNTPVHLTHAGDGSNRLFVVEKRGTIQVFDNDPDVTDSRVFLDIRDRVNSSYSESGLLSLAFPPGYPDDPRVFVYYNTGNLTSRISEIIVTGTPERADADQERVILELDQPAGNHNGGQIAFGPDSLLYIGLGDGGGAGDPYDNGQDRTTLLGAILRVDVRDPDVDGYAVPGDNPYVGNEQGWKEEIWAWGFRNPWRFSFDRQTGTLWTGDVGQNQWEEVDRVQKGKNYGWNIMEGTHCYPPGSECDTTGLALPVTEYSHNVGLSITGGFVYRGQRLGDLNGHYLFGDFIQRQIWSLPSDSEPGAEAVQIATSSSSISSFGEDEQGEIYVVGFDGSIATLGDPATAVAPSEPDQLPGTVELLPAYPNPFNPETRIAFDLPKAMTVTLEIVDIRGRQVQSLAEGRFAAGRHNVVWRADSVTSGTYYAVLQAGSHRQVQPLTLLR
jgi:glucose/arabinose dehydrogenase